MYQHVVRKTDTTRGCIRASYNDALGNSDYTEVNDTDLRIIQVKYVEGSGHCQILR